MDEKLNKLSKRITQVVERERQHEQQMGRILQTTKDPLYVPKPNLSEESPIKVFDSNMDSDKIKSVSMICHLVLSMKYHFVIHIP